jgi:hypothetical protein
MRSLKAVSPPVFNPFQTGLRISGLGYSLAAGFRTALPTPPPARAPKGYNANYQVAPLKLYKKEATRSKIAPVFVFAWRINMLNTDNLLVLVASLLLLFVNWLAFHDIRETHTVRDWLMLIASILVFIKFAREFWNRHFGQV